MNYRYLLFDFDDTLLDFKKTEEDAFHNAMKRAGIEDKPGYLERYSAINHKKWMQLNEGLLTKQEVLITRFEDFFGEIGAKVNPEEFQKIYAQALSEPVHYVEGVTEVLSELCKDHELYIVTNGIKKVQEPRFSRCDFKDYIKKVYVSEEIGYEKPTKEYFDIVFADIPGFNKEEALIIGDTLSSDIRGGNNAGIATCWFNPNQKPHNGIEHVDYEIRNLQELLDILN